ncbi:transcription factor IIIC subunit delta N-term-domain-containing protein [Naematelia encephala]|uniref:Transcription factor IIIC subunit delta N-term-domain-containing protein n=1 Tax=Naematelia encephala TaxID=71784 RepID=A0A1Y2BHL9_9TREE|nr:transcription factor IIIC subunit delta N-term-domain-containing protein [Naematelia encephala]
MMDLGATTAEDAQDPFIPPTHLSSRIWPNLSPSPNHGNLSYSDDGQFLFIHRRGVNILTPCITSSRGPPNDPIDVSDVLEHPNAAHIRLKRQRQEEAQIQDDEDEVPAADSQSKEPRTKLRRPTGGEVQWYTTTIDYEKDWLRDDEYGWIPSRDSYDIPNADLEVSIRSAIWSPSGVSRLGGCIIAVMLGNGQISLFSPQSDPASKAWLEVTDLTMATKRLFGSADLKPADMLEMRATSMAWSSRPSLFSNIDGSLLAIGSRAGSIALWSGHERIAHQTVSQRWISRLAWSDWTMMDEKKCRARLAMAMVDGSVAVLRVDRIKTEDGWNIETGNLQVIVKPDKRDITAVQWADGMLVWTKSGSVHLWADRLTKAKWNGVKTIRLQRVGNWASANALLPCIGIQHNHDRIIIVLSSLSHHIIADLSTEPVLAPLIDSLKLSILAREAFIDLTTQESYTRARHAMSSSSDREISAYTSGWAAMDTTFAWVTEPISFHNLDSITDARRTMAFQMVELGSTGRSPRSIGEALEEVLENPPALIRTSPLKVLFPIITRISASPQDFSAELLELCSVDAPTLGQLDSLDALWTTPILDGLRLRLVLATWAANAFTESSEFSSLINSVTSVIRRIVLGIFVRWAAQQSIKYAEDELVLGLLRHAAADAQLHDQLKDELSQLPVTPGETDKCLACGEPVSLDSNATCSRGHRWCEFLMFILKLTSDRCSITNFLITTPTYRSCSACPALSLLPVFGLQTPPHVSDNGNSDGNLTNGTTSLVQTMLKAAHCCVICGGRWTRSV